MRGRVRRRHLRVLAGRRAAAFHSALGQKLVSPHSLPHSFPHSLSVSLSSRTDEPTHALSAFSRCD